MAPRDALGLSLLEIWEEMLEASGVGIRTSFFAIGGDRGLAEVMLERVEGLFGARVPLDTFLEDPTIEGLTTAVEDAEGTDLPESFVAFSPTPDGSEAGRALFFVSDRSSERLVRTLGKEVPVFLLPYIAVDRPALASIEATAASCVETVRRLQPKGPYRLGGFCLGALVAFEMSRRLKMEGETVDPLILIAPRPWSHRWFSRRRFGWAARLLMLKVDEELHIFARLTEVIPHWESQWRSYVDRAGHWLRRPASEKIDVIVRKTRRGLRSLARRSADPAAIPIDSSPPSRAVLARRKRHREAWTVYKRVNRTYVPGRYSGRVTILWPEGETRILPGYPDGLWRPLVRAVDLEIVRGGHVTCLTRYVEEIAATVKACLARAQDDSAISVPDSQDAAQASTRGR